MLIPHIEGDTSLIRHKEHDKINGHLNIRPTHVILAGNGAIIGGTIPLLKAIKEVTTREIAESAAASVAAVLAQNYKGNKLFALKDLSEVIENVGSLDKYLAEYYLFKSALSKYYSESYIKGELKLRSSESIKSAITLVPPKNVGLITTNWDACIWNANEFENVIQLHGLAGEPESIVLPGEFASDEEFADVLENHGFEIEDDNIRAQVQRMFRGNFRRPLTAALQTADQWLNSAETIVIWGFAFHPYDSEVCKLAWDVSQKLREAKQLIIVNPSERDRDVCKFLFSSGKIVRTEFSA
jgi:hypothetical protein